jgi:hypothetical protein
VRERNSCYRRRREIGGSMNNHQGRTLTVAHWDLFLFPFSQKERPLRLLLSRNETCSAATRTRKVRRKRRGHPTKKATPMSGGHPARLSTPSTGRADMPPRGERVWACLYPATPCSTERTSQGKVCANTNSHLRDGCDRVHSIAKRYNAFCEGEETCWFRNEFETPRVPSVRGRERYS